MHECTPFLQPIPEVVCVTEWAELSGSLLFPECRLSQRSGQGSEPLSFVPCISWLFLLLQAYLSLVVQNFSPYNVFISFYCSIKAQWPRPLTEEIIGAYSFRVLVHDHSDEKHGGRQAGLVLKKYLRAQISSTSKRWGVGGCWGC